MPNAFASAGSLGATIIGTTAGDATCLTSPQAQGGCGAPAANRGFGVASTLAAAEVGGEYFGASQTDVGQGTVATPWQKTHGADGATTSNNTTVGCYVAITHMQQYQGFSFEELRTQDYASDRKTVDAERLARNAAAWGESGFCQAQIFMPNAFASAGNLGATIADSCGSATVGGAACLTGSQVQELLTRAKCEIGLFQALPDGRCWRSKVVNGKLAFVCEVPGSDASRVEDEQRCAGVNT